jgi:diguanylate cyclase (GGDEF)-like protein
MLKANAFVTAPDQDELRGFGRTVAEIQWLLVVLVLVYLVAVDLDDESAFAIYTALGLLAAFILTLHYVHFYKKETLTKLAVETVVMFAFITWVTWYSGKIDSPLLNLYLLPIIASSLILGKLITSILTAGVILCYVAMANDSGLNNPDTLSYWVMLFALIAPIVLVAYITTMLSADIRYAMAKIKRISDTDELTGVYNMRSFSAILRRMFQQTVRHGHPMSIIMIDSDNLKAVNDTHGHNAGNKLLQHLIRKVGEELRRSDIVARYGGDEFIILLPETERQGAMETAERIRQSFETSQFNYRGNSLSVTVSLGLASYPEDGRNVDLIVDKADKALYRAKRLGRNQTAVYEVKDDPHAPAPSRPDLKYETSS